MNPLLDWDLISLVAAVAPLWFGLFVLVFWTRDFLGSRHDRTQARSAAFNQWEARRELLMLQREATQMLRQIEGKRPTLALTAERKGGAIAVHFSRIRFTDENKPILELDTPKVKIDLDEERMQTLIEDRSFFEVLMENPQAFQFLLENADNLALLRRLMRQAAEQTR